MRDRDDGPPMGQPAMQSKVMEAQCSTERRQRCLTPQRKAELFTVAQGIAAQVNAQVREGPERCLLRQMVEMLLEST